MFRCKVCHPHHQSVSEEQVFIPLQKRRVVSCFPHNLSATFLYGLFPVDNEYTTIFFISSAAGFKVIAYL